jgi:hypothetical protein
MAMRETLPARRRRADHHRAGHSGKTIVEDSPPASRFVRMTVPAAASKSERSVRSAFLVRTPAMS